MSYLTRKRLDVPEVHALLHAQARLLTDYAETDPGSPERNDLLRALHAAADALADRAYGGPTIGAWLSYWLRPYDPKRDDRCWRWRRLPYFALVLDDREATR